MFEFAVKKENLIGPLLTVAGAVDKKQSLAILSNFLFKVDNNTLFISATDLEIEMSARVVCDSKSSNGQITVPAKKFIDIIRSLEDNAEPSIKFNQTAITIKQGRSSFKLSTLDADNYPLSEDPCSDVELSLARIELLNLLQSTHFAMSQHDVRVFLNGLYLDFEPGIISAVATDGHRMAINSLQCNHISDKKLLIPKKGIQEILRLLNSIDDELITLAAGKSHVKITTSQFTFLSKLIEARFPPYVKAIPKNQDKHLTIECAILKRSLARIVILAHEKSKAVLIHFQHNLLTLIANNNDQEEAIEMVVAETEGDELKIGINATYLLDVLNHFNDGKIHISMSQTDSSILVKSLSDPSYQYIIMPMKI